MLDVLTIVRPDTPADWLQRCRDSIAGAAAVAGYPVQIIEAHSVPGHIGQAQITALQFTSMPYTVFVDDDDYVLPRAFACLAPHFAGNPRAICAREIQLGARGQQVPQSRRHHLTAWRRAVLQAWLPDIGACVAGLTSTANAQKLFREAAADVVDVPEHVYVWRRYRSGGTALRNQAKAEAA